MNGQNLENTEQRRDFKTRNLLFAMIFICVFVIPSIARAAGVQASVDRKNVTIGESLRLTISISKAGGDVDVSPIKHFKIIQQGVTNYHNIVNGKASRGVEYNYSLIPLKQGSLTIPQLKVESEGKIYKTQKIVIQVSDRKTRNSNSREVFAEAHISNANPYEGQQIIYTFKFYHAVQLGRGINFQRPDFSGFTAEQLGKETHHKIAVAGKRYDVIELRYVLVPLNPGKKTIGPAVLECNIVRSQQKNRSRGFFDNPFFGNAKLERRAVKTEALAINVKPLPAYDGDAEFSGLVGKFDIRAEIGADKLRVGDSTTLSVTISGNGNIMDAGMPKIGVSEAFKAYADDPDEAIRLNAGGYTGKKIFRTALVPIREGQYSLEPIRISYFDVSRGKYQTRMTRAFSISVSPSEKKDELEVFSAPSGEVVSLKKKVELTGQDILPLKEELDALENQKSLSPPGFIFLILLPTFFWMMMRAYLVITRKNDEPGRIMADRAEKALKNACSIEISGEEFLSCLYRSLVSAIFSKAGVRGESLTYAEAAEILLSKGYSEEIAGSAAELLEKIESAKFSGLDMDREFRESLLSETKHLFRSLS